MLIIIAFLYLVSFFCLKFGLELNYSGTFVALSFLSILFTLMAPLLMGQVGIVVFLFTIPGFFIFGILAVIARIIEDNSDKTNK